MDNRCSVPSVHGGVESGVDATEPYSSEKKQINTVNILHKSTIKSAKAKQKYQKYKCIVAVNPFLPPSHIHLNSVKPFKTFNVGVLTEIINSIKAPTLQYLAMSHF